MRGEVESTQVGVYIFEIYYFQMGSRCKKKQVLKGILQGDNLTPLLFVLCMDTLSHKLNDKYLEIEVNCGDVSHTCNHLLFVDDLKLLAMSHVKLKPLVDEAFIFFKLLSSK